MKVIDVIEDTLILLNKKTLLEKVQQYKLENQDDTSALLGNILSKSISPSIEDGSMSLNNVEDGGNIENSINTVNSEDGESVANNDSEVDGEEDGTGIVSIFDETDLNELDILVRCFNLVYSEICVYFLPLIKEEMYNGISTQPIVVNNVSIDRGSSASLDKHLRLTEIGTMEALENYGNGIWNIHSNTE